MPFNHKEIEPKWQKYWDEHKTFKTDCYDDSKPKYYCVDMFPDVYKRQWEKLDKVEILKKYL